MKLRLKLKLWIVWILCKNKKELDMEIKVNKSYWKSSPNFVELLKFLFLAKWTDACLNISFNHFWCDILDKVIDLNVSDATLIVASTLHATNLGQMGMSTQEKWSCCIECRLVTTADIWFWREVINNDRNYELRFDDGNWKMLENKKRWNINRMRKLSHFTHQNAIRHHTVICQRQWMR